MDYRLTNVDRLYEARYNAIQDALKRDDNEAVKALCIPMLEDPFLPPFFRAGYLIMLSLIDNDPEPKLHNALTIIGEMEKILETEMGGAVDPAIQRLKDAAQNLLDNMTDIEEKDEEGSKEKEEAISKKEALLLEREEAVSQEVIEDSGPSQNIPEQLFSAAEGFGITETEVTTGVESEGAGEPLKRRLPPVAPAPLRANTGNPFANLPTLHATDAGAGPPSPSRRVSPQRKTADELAEEAGDEMERDNTRTRRSQSPSKRKRTGGVTEGDGEESKKAKKEE